MLNLILASGSKLTETTLLFHLYTSASLLQRKHFSRFSLSEPALYYNRISDYLLVVQELLLALAVGVWRMEGAVKWKGSTEDTVRTRYFKLHPYFTQSH